MKIRVNRRFKVVKFVAVEKESFRVTVLLSSGSWEEGDPVELTSH